MPPADAAETPAADAAPAAPPAPAAAPAVPGVADEDLDVFGVNVNDVNGTGEPSGSQDEAHWSQVRKINL